MGGAPEDDRVRVTATLVNHFPVFPAFAYRFDTDDGSVVISGDTGISTNLAVMAAGTDLLLHEVIDSSYIDALYERNKNASLRHHLMTAHTPSTELGRFAEDLGARIIANLVMLGFFSAVTGIVSAEAMKKALPGLVPDSFIELNCRAFDKGYEYGQQVKQREHEKTSEPAQRFFLACGWD